MSDATIIDAALRFARSNPELLAVARGAAPRIGSSVDELLINAIKGVRAALEPTPAIAERMAAGGLCVSTAPAVAEEQVRLRPPRRQQLVVLK